MFYVQSVDGPKEFYWATWVVILGSPADKMQQECYVSSLLKSLCFSVGLIHTQFDFFLRINTQSSRPSIPLSTASSKQSSVSQCVTPQKVIPLSPSVSTTPEKERLRMKRMISTVNKKNFKGRNCFLSRTSKVWIVFYLELQRYELFSIWSFKDINCFLCETSKVGIVFYLELQRY